MKRFACAPWIAGLLLSNASFADTDIAKFLNDALAKKNVVQKNRTKTVRQRVCDWNGDLPPNNMHCYYDNFDVPVTVLEPAIATSTSVSQATPVIFESAKASQLPSSIHMQTGRFTNCSSAGFSPTTSLSVTGTQGWSVSKSHSVNSNVTVSVSGSVSFFGLAGATTTVTASLGYSDNTTNSETKSESLTRFFGASTSLTKNQAVEMELIAYQYAADVPFHSTIIVDGPLEAETVGASKASDLLTAQERTLPFDGTIRVEGLSEGVGRQRDIKVVCSDAANQGKTTEKINPQQNFPVTPASNNYFKRMSNFDAALEKANGSGRQFVADATIGPPDGVHYEIVSSSVVTRMNPACGFNDGGAPNGGNFLVEVRRYENWSNGQLAGSWTETVEVFQGCASGP